MMNQGILSVSEAFDHALHVWNSTCATHFSSSINERFCEDLSQAKEAFASRSLHITDEIVQRWYLWAVEQSYTAGIDSPSLDHVELEEALLQLQTALREDRMMKKTDL